MQPRGIGGLGEINVTYLPLGLVTTESTPSIPAASQRAPLAPSATTPVPAILPGPISEFTNPSGKYVTHQFGALQRTRGIGRKRCYVFAARVSNQRQICFVAAGKRDALVARLLLWWTYSRFYSNTVQALAKPKSLRRHSMASNPRIVRRGRAEGLKAVLRRSTQQIPRDRRIDGATARCRPGPRLVPPLLEREGVAPVSSGTPERPTPGPEVVACSRSKAPSARWTP
jgi:hypothetical protein